MFRPNRWQLYLTTRRGLGIFTNVDPYAPTFEFGEHFVIDLFINFTHTSRDTSFLDHTVYHGIEYIEAPDKQDHFNAAQRPIDSNSLIHHLEFEVAELDRDISAGDKLGFLGDPSVHLQAMKDAISFLRSHSDTPFYLIADYDD